MPGRFTRLQRLLRPQQFSRVFAEPCRCKSPNFTLIMRKSALQVGRLGITIAKRNIRQAVSRNRLKRQIRETFRQQAPLLSGYDMVVLARAGADKRSNAELRTELLGLWGQGIARCVNS